MNVSLIRAPCGVILMYIGYRVCSRYLGLFVLSSQITKVNFPQITDDNYILVSCDPLKVSNEPMGMKLKLIRKNWSRGYKTFFVLNSTEHGIYHVIYVKTPTIVGILTFISVINTTTESLKARKFLTFQPLVL